MRELKFRAWISKGKHDNVSYNTSFMDNNVFLSDKGFYCDIEGGWDIHSVLPSIPVMQFTGLKDKNDKEIYESDIVRILYTDWSSKSDSDPRTLEQYLIDISHVGQVVFNDNSWEVKKHSIKYNDFIFSSINHGKYGFIEVIGNIYENPELLS